MSENTKRDSAPKRSLPVLAMLVLAVLRIAIGWHFLYEGLVKLTDPAWTSAGYLVTASGPFAETFQRMAESPAVLRGIDLLNMWGLTLLGVALILGCFSRLTSLLGAILLALYYLANPPLAELAKSPWAEGAYLLVDKNFVEMVALLVLATVPTGRFLGMDGLARALFARRGEGGQTSGRKDGPAVDRRQWLRHLATIPALGGFVYAYQKRHGWETFEVKRLLDFQREASVDAVSGATIKTFDFAKLDELKGQVPHARLGGLELSRMFLGGNLIGGWAHARDLIYVSKLVKAYHHDAKVFETFYLAEQCGMNTILTNPALSRVINDYWNKEGGRIQFISDCSVKGDPILGIKQSIDGGAHACYVQGGISDNLVQRGDYDLMARALDLIRKNGLPAGIGAHRIETVQGCVEQGLKPDFWVKTIHHTDYWSALPEPQYDNIWCQKPAETAAFMEQLEEPWIGFKTLAAGAIHPNAGFPYALENGADFLCVGMYDFQVVENVNLFLDVYANLGERRRPWRA